MKSKLFIFIFIGLFLGQTLVTAQNKNCYEKLDFKSFLCQKVEHDTSFVKELYRNIKYPVGMRKYEVEGLVEVLVINHNERNIEIIQLNLRNTFPDVVKGVNTAITKSTINRKSPFITRLLIHFALDTIRYKKEDYQKYHLGLINNNTLTILDYLVPEINSH